MLIDLESFQFSSVQMEPIYVFFLAFKVQAFGLRSLDLSLVAAWSGMVAGGASI